MLEAWKMLLDYRKWLFYKIQRLLTKVFLYRADDGAKAAVHLLDAARQTGEKKKTAANIAFNYSETLFEWMASFGNEWRGERASRAMVQLHEMANGGVGEGKSRTAPLNGVEIYMKVQISPGMVWNVR